MAKWFLHALARPEWPRYISVCFSHTHTRARVYTHTHTHTHNTHTHTDVIIHKGLLPSYLDAAVKYVIIEKPHPTLPRASLKLRKTNRLPRKCRILISYVRLTIIRPILVVCTSKRKYCQVQASFKALTLRRRTGFDYTTLHCFSSVYTIYKNASQFLPVVMK